MSSESSFTESSGNVFADLGLPDAGTRSAKAELACSITTIMQERRLTQREAAGLLGIDQPKVSAITRGRLSDFSLERLLMLVSRLGMDIDITVSPNPEPSRPARMSSMARMSHWLPPSIRIVRSAPGSTSPDYSSVSEGKYCHDRRWITVTRQSPRLPNGADAA